jgi:hypothetical protein
VVVAVVLAALSACGGPVAEEELQEPVPTGLDVQLDRHLVGFRAAGLTGVAPGGADELIALVPAEQSGGRTELFNELSGERAGEAIELLVDTEVAGLPCAAGVLNVWQETWGCELARDFELGGLTSAAGDYLGVHYGTGGRVSASGDSLVPPVEMIELAGVACDRWAAFHPDGSLAVCDLAADHMIGAIMLTAETTVTLRPDGTVEMAIIYVPHEFGGTNYAPGTIEFDETGTVTWHAEDIFGE